eukprot:TRINITY_DN1188_c0_g1_i12.p1 TRINITY_DN1188_c0_g1~~TRINITY_DN1188_c0_g1_i12.p1  ORF type:complete len:464 (-),score=132.12 TRINITY_DN1188_c0_g1_i12:18-1409(-)
MTDVEQGGTMLNMGKAYLNGKGIEANTKIGVKVLKKAVELGNDEAAYILGDMYQQGTVVTQNNENAIKYLTKASKTVPDAMVSLGLLKYNGIGCDVDYIEAFELFEKAAHLDHGKAMKLMGYMYYYGDHDNGIPHLGLAFDMFKAAYDVGLKDCALNLGKMYASGEGIEQDFTKAIEYLKEAASLDISEAMLIMGEMYHDGEGVDIDFNESIKWLNKASSLGNDEAIVYLGWCYLRGEGFEQSTEKAIELFRKAADSGNSSSFFSLGEALQSSGDKECLEWFLKSAEKGNSNAMNSLGRLYSDGDIIEIDKAEAFKWFKLSAEKENQDSYLSLAGMYYYGEHSEEGTPNYEEALKWFTEAAKNDNTTAMMYIGGMFLYGDGVEIDVDRGLKWIRISAEENTDAMVMLGSLYFDGDIVNPDIYKAIHWFEKAKDRGNIEAQELYEDALKRMQYEDKELDFPPRK